MGFHYLCSGGLLGLAFDSSMVFAPLAQFVVENFGDSLIDRTMEGFLELLAISGKHAIYRHRLRALRQKAVLGCEAGTQLRVSDS